MMGALRYASHLGYRSPTEPLFRELAGGLEPQAHIRLAAELGFSGVLYPWAVGRPADEVDQVAEALTRHALQGGCVVYAPMDVLMQPYWVSRSRVAQSILLDHLKLGVAFAERLMSRVVAVLVKADVDRSYRDQRASLIENLKVGADLVVARGAVIGIEPMIALPGMFLPNFAEAYDIVRTVDHPGVKLIFDTGHLWSMGDPIMASFTNCFDGICTIQLADQPGRHEPGSGEIDFVPLLAHAMRMGFEGLVELEHGWATPGRESEEAGYRRIKEFDRLARLGEAYTT